MMKLNAVICFAAFLTLHATAQSSQAVQWKHPAGLVTEDTVAEIKEKLATQEWARKVYNNRKVTLDRWAKVSSEELKRVFPTKRGNVYHNFSCPDDRCRLKFDPFQPDVFKCPLCGKTYAPDTDAGIYKPDDKYHSTMYEGWICLFHLEAGAIAADMGLAGCIENRKDYLERGVEILMLYANTIENLKTDRRKYRQHDRILTYHREGDNKVLNDLSGAYELLRSHMTATQCAHFEKAVLERFLNDIMLEPIYSYDHNNVYQWHRTIVQTGLALEREELIDWSLGYGKCSPENEPEHRSIRYQAAHHFKPDGAFWEMCSGYHLYPLHPFCELAVITRNMVKMDPKRFPAEKYDLTSQTSAVGKVIGNALHWFMSMAMPDRTMPTIGDSMMPRAGMDDYYATAEIGYRYFDLKAVGDYESFRQGKRNWAALIYGADQIEQHELPYTSSYLSSGWVSLRNEWQGNKVWLGLNAFIPGGSHQHADRLTLLSYSHGQLLALEKATPYNEDVTRKLGTFSQSHNTVTVDQVSQKQGEQLKGDEIPHVAYFFAGSVAKFAELQGDHIYSQTKIYRRSVALIEDVWVDFFDVQGGSTHDWMVQHAGSAPQLSIPMQPATFEPKDWIYNGTDKILSANTDDTWQTQWSVSDSATKKTMGGGSKPVSASDKVVTSRLTMLGSAETQVYALETYPIDNAVVTPENPPCQSLVVRRHDDAPFLAIWDAHRGSPNLKSVSPGSSQRSLRIKTASNTYYLLFGPGETRFDDGVSLKSDATFACWRADNAALFVGGTTYEVKNTWGHVQIAGDVRASVSVEYADGTATIETAGDIEYDTVGGQDVPRPTPKVNVAIEGNLWQINKRQDR